MSGNKVRKLEFLMADAKARGHDCVSAKPSSSWVLMQ
jgi:1-aminocyclopropane-1-carboxylate deaminase/D-cysteine desulfhydrase-like pyridoxal-dependent ACC family enzyme